MLTAVSVCGHAEVRPVDTLDPIEEELSDAGKETLVLLDIGHTLLDHKDAIMDPRFEEWKRNWFQKHCPKPERASRVATARAVESAFENWTLVDERWPHVVQKMQARGIQVVALSKVVVDPSLLGLRGKNLKAFGILLKDELSGLPAGKSYVYTDGVIETEEPLKGPVLKELFSKLNKRPARIVFVDDRLNQAKSIDEACKELGIPCISFHYTAYQKTIRELDEKVADYQLRVLLDECRWISELEARKKLAS